MDVDLPRRCTFDFQAMVLDPPSCWKSKSRAFPSGPSHERTIVLRTDAPAPERRSPRLRVGGARPLSLGPTPG